MTVTTPVPWSYRGVNLNNLAWNIKTRGGSRMGTADPRGEDQLVPGMTGRRYLYKYRDSRIITLQMWVRGADVDGTRPVGRENLAVLFDQNWNALANLFDDEGQFPLAKTIRDGSGGFLTVTAMAEYNSGLDPDIEEEYRADFSPALLLADPWFYSDVVSGLSGSVNILGNKPTDRVVITLPAGSQMTWSGGDRFIRNESAVTATIDCKERSAYGTVTYVNGSIVRDRNTADWATLHPGVNNFAFTSGGSFAYQSAWR